MTTPQYRQVPAQVDLPALEHAVLDFWREQQDLRQHPRAVRGPPRVGLLRGPARPPTACPGAHHIEARVFKDVFPRFRTMQRLPRGPQGRLGLPRPAGRAGGGEGARLQRQAGHRGVRHRRVQRQVPRVGDPAHRRLRRADDPHGVLGRPGRRLPHDGPGVHRVGLVVAQGDLRQGPAGPGPPRRPLVPALRHRPVGPRAGAGLRDGRRPVRLRPLPAHLRPARRRGRAPGLDDHPLDAGVQHGGRRAPRGRLRRGDGRRREKLVVAEPLRRQGARRGLGDHRPDLHRRRDGALDVSNARSNSSSSRSAPTTWSTPSTSPPRTVPAWSTSRRPSARTTSRSAAPTACRS